MNNDESFKLELQRSFLTETKEMLDDTETAFMEIESNPDDSGKIDKIFRLVHSIKGSANMAGFNRLGAFAHRFETILSLLREKKLRADSEIIDTLLVGNDALKRFIEVLTDDKDADCDIDHAESKIKNILNRSTSKEKVEKKDAKHVLQKEEKSKPEPEISKKVAKSEKDPSKPVFLICDDDENILELMRLMLESDNYKVIAAENGLLALELMEKHHVDVIMTDLSMPQMTGTEFISKIRERNNMIPIAFVSGFSSRDDFKSFLKLGVDEFVEKPFNDVDLLRTASKLVRIAELRKSILQLSKVAFEAYMAIARIKTHLNIRELKEDELKDSLKLDSCMNELVKITNQIIKNEKEKII